MTEAQQSILYDLNGRGWCLLSPDHQRSRYIECSDVYLLDKSGVLYRICREGKLVRMIPGPVCEFDGELICPIEEKA